MREDIKPGAIFPDFELPDHTNTLRKLSLLQGEDPMILTLCRGNFCPKDHLQLSQLAKFSSQCDVGYTRIVTITCDNLFSTNDLKLSVGAHWPFLYDTKRIVMNDLDIHEYTYPVSKVMIPHTFLLEPGLKIYKIYNGYWYWGRPSTAELHQDLRDIIMKCRPDYKIDSQDMREKWKNGNKDDFFPYGMTWEQMFIRMSGDVDQFKDE